MDWKLTLTMIPNILWIVMGIMFWSGIDFPAARFMAGLACIGCGLLVGINDLKVHYQRKLEELRKQSR